MSKITAIGNIPSMADDEVILDIRGIIKQVWPQEEKSGQNGPYKSQAFIISDGATGATALVRAFGQPEIKIDQVGSLIRLTPSIGGAGLTKTSFKRTTGDKAGQTDHSIKASSAAVITIKKQGDAATASPDRGNAAPQAQQRQPAQNSRLREIGDLFLACLHEASRIVMESPFPINDSRELATTLFIECNKKGIMEKPPARATKSTAPAPAAEESPEPEVKTEPEPPQPEPATPPQSLTPAGLAAKAIAMPGSAEIARSLSVASAATIEKAADLLFMELIDLGEATPQQLDSAFIAWKKLQESANDNLDPNTAMLASFDVFKKVLKNHAKPVDPVQEEVTIIEDDEMMPEIEI